MIVLKHLETPLGLCLIGATDKGICLLDFVDEGNPEEHIQQLEKLTGMKSQTGEHAYLNLLEEQLGEYFEKRRTEFTLPLFTPGTEFQQTVWEVLQTVPYGSIRSYKQQAAVLGKPEAVRAVASANGQNRVAILIPCHRIVGSTGKLTGYRGGLWRKKSLLDLENGALF